MPHIHNQPNRILVVGSSGAGKSTLAKQLANIYNLPYHATDAYYWHDNWERAASDHVDKQLSPVLVNTQWVLDGNFDRQWEEVWHQADLLVWLDYSLPTLLWQVNTRNLNWLIARKKVWAGNRMTLAKAISGCRHTIRSYAKKKRLFPDRLQQLSETQTHRFSNRHMTNKWLNDLKQHQAKQA